VLRRYLAGALAGLLALTLAGMPDAAVGYRPQEGATFNIPRPWGSEAEKWRIMAKVERAINHTPKGATIFVSAFLFDREKFTNKLIAAKRRGVKVRVVIDKDIEAGAASRLARVLNRDNRRVKNLEKSWGRDGSYLYRCKWSCRGDRGGNVHTKMYVFSEVCRARQERPRDKCRRPSARNIVMVSSANPNKGGAYKGWNDMYTMVNRPKSYRLYARVHREMTEDSPRDNDGLIEVRDGPFVHRFTPMQRTTRRTDPSMRDLRGIRCHNVARGYGINRRTSVHISMFWWVGPRGERQARKVLELARRGCNVNVIYGAPSHLVARMLGDAARRGQIRLYDSRWWFGTDREVDVRSHEKYVLVNGHVRRDHGTRRVYTGSLNWNGANLTWSDDSMLNIRGRRAYRQYLNNWHMVRNHSKRIPPPV
jgi:hypothetical protein